ncbi:MAG: EamA family transporter [Bacteroidaceae bacterium]|nr:EamA family transporter [Prevotellaceae bacterium]MDY5631249.1 EamA family transporter [Bacteroidaceae bacterium]
MSDKAKGFAAAVLAAMFYGTNPLGTLPMYADGVNSSTVLFYRYAFAVAMFAVLLLLRGQSLRIKWGHAIRLAMLGVFFSLSSITLYLSFHHMAAGIASTLLFVYPVMTAVLMAAFFHERITWRTACSILLALLGVALLYRGDDGGRLSMTGFTLVMVSSLVYSLYIVAVNQWKTDIPPMKFTFWVLLFGWAAIVVYSLLAGEPLALALPTTRSWLCALQLALMPTVLSLYFMTVGIKLIGSTPSAIMGALEPVTAVVIGLLLFGEHVSGRMLLGIALILGAVTLIILRKKTVQA